MTGQVETLNFLPLTGADGVNCTSTQFLLFVFKILSVLTLPH